MAEANRIEDPNPDAMPCNLDGTQGVNTLGARHHLHNADAEWMIEKKWCERRDRGNKDRERGKSGNRSGGG